MAPAGCSPPPLPCGYDPRASRRPYRSPRQLVRLSREHPRRLRDRHEDRLRLARARCTDDDMAVPRRPYIELEPVAADLHGDRGGVEGVLERGVRVAVVSDTGDGTRGGHSRTVAAVVNSPPAPW